MEKLQKNFDKKLSEEKVLREQAIAEKDQVEREAREKETRLLNLLRELEERNELYVELDKKYKQLKLEYDDTLSHKDDVGKNVHELEKAKRLLESQVDEQRQHIEELEDELQAAEDAKLRLEVNMQASKVQLEKKLQESNDMSEEKYKSLVKQIRDLESDLDDERKQRTSAVNLKKKFELDLNDMKVQFDEANKSKEDNLKQLKKLSISIKEITRECEELRTAKDEIFVASKDWEKKMKNNEMQLIQAQEERDLAERQRKQALSERDDLQHELDSIAGGKNAFIEEKRRFEARILQLEEELEDEQNNTEQLMERFKKNQIDLEKMTSDLQIEKSAASKAENAKILLEKQNRELRDKLTELEEVVKGRNKSIISNLEAKIAAVEEQLHLEANEKQRITREYKKAEKRLRDFQSQIEEERKLTENYKEQLEKMQTKLKTNKRIIDENEEEITQLKNKNRKLARDLDESNDQNEILTRDLTSLRQKQKVSNAMQGKMRQTNYSKIISETTQDIDDEDIDSANSGQHQNGSGNGTGSNQNNTSSSSMSSNSTAKESPTI